MDEIEVDRALSELARDGAPRVLALLARRFGDLDLADDAVQDALVDATRSWGRDGVPGNPAGWLHAAARRRAIDRIRRERRADERLAEVYERQEGDRFPADAGGHLLVERTSPDEELPDERLRLMLLCCHPALGPEAQTALTLRLVGGLTTAEIAAAHLAPESTIAQRISRAKRKIRAANIPMSMPDRLDDRLSVVAEVLYLVFNEGYLSRSGAVSPVRIDLADEAIRLTRLLDRLTGAAEVRGLLALQLYLRARATTRVDGEGELVLLDDQDRSAWDRDLITEANAALRAAMAVMAPGPYQLQAAIAGYHANAPTAADTEWTTIVSLYDQLLTTTGSPIVRLNRAVAISMVDGPAAGLAELDATEGLDDYHLSWAARAELSRRAGDLDGARRSLHRALSLVVAPVERRHLERRLDELG
ncbi:MAG: sigma-70 family RNA polymerase sigma factor [Actinomycetota bacterium]